MSTINIQIRRAVGTTGDKADNKSSLTGKVFGTALVARVYPGTFGNFTPDLTDWTFDIYQLIDGKSTRTEYTLFDDAKNHKQTLETATSVYDNRSGERGYNANQAPVSYNPFEHITVRNNITTTYPFTIGIARTIITLHEIQPSTQFVRH